MMPKRKVMDYNPAYSHLRRCSAVSRVLEDNLYLGQCWRAWTWRGRPVQQQLHSRATPVWENIENPLETAWKSDLKRKLLRTSKKPLFNQLCLHLIRLEVFLADVSIVVRRLVHPHQEVKVCQLPHLWKCTWTLKKRTNPNANMQIYKYANIQICKYTSTLY